MVIQHLLCYYILRSIVWGIRERKNACFVRAGRTREVTMLKLVDITKEYRTEDESVLALRNVSIEFRQNEFVSILGPSGCGKTTLLNIIGGLDRYTSGDIQVEGVSTKQYRDEDWDTYRNRRIGFVFQSYNLIPHMNVLKNVQLSLTLAGVSKEEGRERAMEALKKVGLEKQAKKKPNQMSGGQMQRVAIARALVNNPDIILADEPTGALDSESGLQVMELLKEVAKDRLVIMVTHNGQLAEEYSTRIVRLKDGEVVGDTMPYDHAEEAKVAEFAKEDVDGTENASSNIVLDENGNPVPAEEKAPAAKKGFFARIRERIRAIKKREQSYMSVGTAVNLSWTNLLSKKGRTLLTSIAGSIGIIGIVVVLALSNGVGSYIAGLEENALSQYPITIESQGIDYGQLIDMVLGQTGEKGEEYPSDDKVNVDVVLGNVLKELLHGDLLTKNNLKELKKYLDAHEDEVAEMGVVKYEYGTTLNIYTDDPKNDDKYMKVNPFTDAMPSWLDQDMAAMASTFGAGWDEISANRDLLDRQYDLIGDGSRWPENANEVVIVVDKYNSLPDFAMFILGLRSQDDLGTVIGSGDKNSEFYESFDIEDLIGKEYKVVSDAEYYMQQDENGEWVYSATSLPRNTLDKATVDAMDSVPIKVVGIVRPKKGVTVTSINGYIGYTHALSELMLEKAEESEAAQSQLQAALAAANKNTGDYPVTEITYQNFKKYKSVVNVGNVIYDGDNVPEDGVAVGVGTEITSFAMHTEVMRKLGVADPETPQTIKIYSHSFDSKAEIEAFLKNYTEETGRPVKYTDQLAIIMSFVEEMSDTVTQVLVGFAAISLIVSTIMIAIIIYTSVLERRKEIGVLRSLGARKKDISRVFIAESAILGAYSGAIGVLVAVAFSFAGSAILAAVLGISGLMAVSWWQCLVMFGISIVLSVLAGFIPSRVASKKDPTVALRSE